jgi:hypothetical protein
VAPLNDIGGSEAKIRKECGRVCLTIRPWINQNMVLDEYSAQTARSTPARAVGQMKQTSVRRLPPASRSATDGSVLDYDVCQRSDLAAVLPAVEVSESKLER